MKIRTILPLIWLALACSETHIIPGERSHEKQPFQLQIEIAETTSGEALYASSEALRRETKSSEAEACVIERLTILQFVPDPADPASSVLRAKIDTVLSPATLEPFNCLLEPTPQEGVLWVVANLSSECFASLQTGTSTLADFQALTVPTETLDAPAFPMAGEWQGFMGYGTTIHLTLERLVAKVSLTCKSTAAGVSIQRVHLLNIPRYTSICPIETTDTPRREKYFEKEMAAFPEGILATGTLTHYLSENLRGENPQILSPEDRTEVAAPSFSTVWVITALHTDGSRTRTIEFMFYPGANLTSDFNLRRNHDYHLEVTIAALPPSDHRGTAISLSKRGSANAYIVNRASTRYRLNATVRGNGTPWVDATGRTDQADLLQPVTAELLWQSRFDAEAGVGLLSDLQLEEGWLSFETPSNGESSTPVPGNAVVGVKDLSGNLLWSWHLWFTPYTPDGEILPAVGITHPLADGSGALHRYHHQERLMMDRNLGALSADAAAQSAEGVLFYQWGRKDPQPASIPLYGFTLYNEDGSANPVAAYEDAGTLALSIENPLTMYNNSNTSFGSDEPTRSAADGLWNDLSASPSKKSLFDPCPPGWQVPTSDIWNDFSAETWADFTYREEAVYPAAGLHTGLIIAPGLVTMWASDAVSLSTAYSLDGQQSKVQIRNSIVRFYGASVRCVKE